MGAILSNEAREALKRDIEQSWGTPHGGVTRVAERHGVSKATVTHWARVLGKTNSAQRAATENATEIKVATNALVREEICERLLRVAKNALDRMEGPAHVFNFGGKDNTFEERVIPDMPSGDRRNEMIIAATALDKHAMLDRYDSQRAGGVQVDLFIQALTGASE